MCLQYLKTIVTRTEAQVFYDYFLEKVGVLSGKKALWQANLIFGQSINYTLTTETEIIFNDGSKLKYSLSGGTCTPST